MVPFNALHKFETKEHLICMIMWGARPIVNLAFINIYLTRLFLYAIKEHVLVKREHKEVKAPKPTAYRWFPQ